MRLIHTSDIHLGQRDNDITKALGFIADEARARNVDLILDGGDTFECKSVPDWRNLAIETHLRMTDAAPMLKVRGNHDHEGDIDFLGRLETRHPLRVVLDREILYFRDGVFTSTPSPIALMIVAIPWIAKADYLGMAGDGPVEGAIMRGARSVIEWGKAAIRDHAGPSVVLMHAAVERGWRSAGDPEIGEEVEFPASWLSEFIAAGASAVLLGHEHDAGEVAPFVHYSGTPAPTTFGERKKKSFNLVTLAEAGYAIERIETPVPPLATVDVTWTGEAMQFTNPEPVPAGSRVRLRYTCPEDQRAAARDAAAREAELIRQGGAIDVVLEPRIVASRRSREASGQVAAARDDWQKILAYFASTALEQRPAPERLPHLEAMFAQAKRSVGLDKARAVSPAIRFDRLRVAGVGSIVEAEVDFRSLGALVAIRGPNGAGKSTFAGQLYGALFREHPDGWQLVDRVADRGAVELDFTNGEAWRSSIAINGTGRKMEARVTDSSGRLAAPGMARPLTGPFDEWIGEHLPSSTFLKATTFAAQFGGGDPIGAKPADLAALFRELLRLDPLDKLAAHFAARISPPKRKGGDEGLRAEADRLRGQLAPVQARADRIAEVKQAHERAKAALKAAQAQLVEARATRDAEVEEGRRWTERKAEIEQRGAAAKATLEAAQQGKQAAEQALQVAEERARQARARVEQLQARIAGAAVVEGAVAALPGLAAESRAAEEELVQAREQLADADRAFADAQAAERDARQRVLRGEQELAREQRARDTAAQVLQRAAAAADDLPGVEARAAMLATTRDQLERTRAAQRAAEEGVARSRAFDEERARAVQAAEARVASAAAVVTRLQAAVRDLPSAEQAERDLPVAVEQAAAAAAARDDLADRIARSEAWAREHTSKSEEAAARAKQADQERGAAAEQVKLLDEVPFGDRCAAAGCRFVARAGTAKGRLPLLDEQIAAIEAERQALARTDPPAWFVLVTAREPMRREALDEVERRTRARDLLAGRVARLPDLRAAAAELAAAEREALEARAERDRLATDTSLPSWYVAPGDRVMDPEPVRAAERAEQEAVAAAARLGDLRVRAAEVEQARQTIQDVEARIVTATEELDGARRAADAAAAEARAAEEKRATAQQAVGESTVVAARAAEQLAQARERAAQMGAIEHARADLQEAEQAVAREVAAVGVARGDAGAASAKVSAATLAREVIANEWRAHERDQPGAMALAAREMDVRDAERVVQDRTGVVGAAAQQLADVQEAVVEADRIEADLSAVLAEIADCELLAKALGREGVQAAEIDAAAPAISDLASELLAEGYGPRWTVEIATQRERANGKGGPVEELFIRVIDAQAGTTGEAKAILSGGERVIVGAALRLAIAAHAMREAGADGASLVLDEPDRGLRGDNHIRYVRMLRRAMRAGGFSQAILIPDHVEVAEACDSRLIVADGTVRVEGRQAGGGVLSVAA